LKPVKRLLLTDQGKALKETGERHYCIT
jgi:hypothetical protein